MAGAGWVWTVRGRCLRFNRPLVMGVVNVTPDSFFDGGRYSTAEAAIAHCRELLRQGADILDIGGESSRPGSKPVPADEEIRRIAPVIRAIVLETQVPVSCDTWKSRTAEAAIEAGASIINDISAGTLDPLLFDVVRRHSAGIILMHMKGTPETMQDNPVYADAAAEIADFLADALSRAHRAGIPAEAVAVDPGIGFGKRVCDNLVILKRLSALAALGRPVVIGASRKSFIGRITGAEPQERLAGSLASAVIAALNGAAVIRTHDVAETRQALAVAEAVMNAGEHEGENPLP